MNKNICSFLILITVSWYGFSQNAGSKLLYTIQQNEKIIMPGEHRILIYHEADYHLLFTQTDSMKYVIYNGKKYGPFEDIREEESSFCLFDWAVKKGGKWYQLILDKDKLEGPYDDVVDTYRSGDYNHYGFRAMKEGQWYVIIDGEEFGPYYKLSSGYPEFSEKGNNWMFEYNTAPTEDFKYGQSFIRFKNGVQNIENIAGFTYMIELSEDSYDCPYIKSDMITYYSSGYSSSGKGSITYYYQGDPNIDFSDYWERSGGSSSKPGRGSIECKVDNETKIIRSISTENKYLANKNGPVAGPFNEVSLFGLDFGNCYAVVKNYEVEKEGQFVPLYTNYEKSPGCYTDVPGATFRRTKSLLINNEKYGPFEDIQTYPVSIAKNGKSVAVVNRDKELLLNGKQTGIKEVSSTRFNYENGNCLTVTGDGSVYFNETFIGKFDLKYFDFIGETDNFFIQHRKADGEYFYTSALQKDFSPYENTAGYEFNTDGKHLAVIADGKIIIDNEILDTEGFGLVYSPASNSFKWLVLKDRQIFQFEYKLSGL